MRAEISDEASHCVACGLCLPHCPTYRLTMSEADSPRGRIALMSGMVAGSIPMNERFALHMDRCLNCRACEAACPNHVRFGQLIDRTRSVMRSSPPVSMGKPGMRRSWFRTWVEREFIAKPLRIDTLRPLLRFYERGLQRWVRKSGVLGKTRLALLEGQLPSIDEPFSLRGGMNAARSWQALYPSIGHHYGEVGLFLGCVARLTDVATLNAAIFVLNRLGYTVHAPSTQICCGALYQHSGDMKAAAQLARQNIVAFDELNLDAIISTASGCGVQLTEYPFSPPSQPPGKPYPIPLEAVEPRDESQAGGKTAGNFRAKVMDISAFLAESEGWNCIKLAPLPQKVLVHEPCSMRNVLRGSAHSYALLARIPDAIVVPLAGNDQCCGAAGTYFLDQPEIAKTLVGEKIATLKVSGARYLATSNVGCAMHIASALREAGAEIEVVHPVTLVARQMGIQL